MCDLDIKEIRNKLEVSQNKLAEMLGVHIRTVQNWESGAKIPHTKYGILYKLLSEEPPLDHNSQPTTHTPQPDERLSEPSSDYPASANREIRLLRQHIIALERTIRDKEEIIRLLKSK